MDIKIRNLKKRFGSVYALNGLTMDISPGIHGLLGANGAGKTTLMRILSSVLLYDSGSISWRDSSEQGKVNDLKKHLGYLPQHFGMYKYLTVKEALQYISALKNIPFKEEKHHIDLALERTHLTEYRDRRVGHLSGGMLKRLGIGQALLGEPDLLILDEPSVGLDPEERIHFRRIVREYCSDGRIILLSSHIVSDLESLCDSISIIHRGEILQHGDTQSLKSIAKGWVNEVIVDANALHTIENEYTIINFKQFGDKYSVRYLENTQNFQSNVTPNLEDSYAVLLRNHKERTLK